jgi:signal transduction histidine kinase
MLIRYEDDGTATNVGGAGEGVSEAFGTQRRVPEGEHVAATVRRTGAPARIDDYSAASGEIRAAVRAAGIQSVVGSPITVAGRLWGCLVAAARTAEAMPRDAEHRMEHFTELVATSIANVQAHSELAASRARVVAATDEERRRVVRDLHDGAQQRLVHTVVTLKLALRALGRNNGSTPAPALVNEALDHAETAMVELRELAHGIMPSVLNRGGLRAGVEALASRMPVPVEIGIGEDRFPRSIEATAYFVVAEALTNVAKHAQARRAIVTTDVDNGALRIEVADDGAGTADPNGHGLLGLRDRVASREGALQVVSTPGDGTRVIATVPLRR